MSLKIKKQQYLVFSLIIGTGCVLLTLLALWGNKPPTTKVVDKAEYKKHTLASPISNAANEAHWIEKTQNAWRAELEKTSQLDKQFKALGDEKEGQKKLLASQKDELAQVKSILVELREQVSRLQAERNSPPDATLKRFQQEGRVLPRAEDAQANSMMAMDSGFIHYAAKLTTVATPRIKTADNYVFSNTFAKAVVLQGADASAGVLSQANPDVMMFQIIDDGVMPNKHKSHLNGCFFSASVVGDISSERGKLRTERISCIHPNGTTLDTQVTGIVSDSKNGIRGRPVWRDGPMVRKAFWGNFWESMGNIGQQYSTDYSTSPLGSVATIQQAKIPLAAASSGGSGAAKMYAQYSIKRAEMYHPVIQLPPGPVVDVIFLKGFWLDGGTDSNAPEKGAQHPSQALENSTDTETPEERAANQFFYKNHSF